MNRMNKRPRIYEWKCPKCGRLLRKHGYDRLADAIAKHKAYRCTGGKELN